MAIPLRRARLASGRLYRRLSGGRILDSVVLHHADPARGIPARHDFPVVGSGIRAGFRFFRTVWITRTSLWAVAKTPMSGPSSARMAPAAEAPIPGMVCSRRSDCASSRFLASSLWRVRSQSATARLSISHA